MTASTFDRFTPHARDALTFADGEATRLNHAAMSTAHLLLGISHEPEGLGGRVLRILGISLSTLRSVVETLYERGAIAIPEGHTLTPDMKVALRAAIAEADRDNQQLVSTLHLLAGLSSDTDNAAMTALRQLEVDETRLRNAIERANEGPVIHASANALAELTSEHVMYILHLPTTDLAHLTALARPTDRPMDDLILEAIHRVWGKDDALAREE